MTWKKEPGVPATSLESSNMRQACSSQGRRRSKPALGGWALQPANFPPQSAGRLRLALECEEHIQAADAGWWDGPHSALGQ